ncbi:DUF1015 domain-containing protein [Dendrosporobacter sp. 1207_IL3150]|uniref:DUF1015 domain-containing protein n=1 Tax=Dendrosporobacter sp. 1207_IL3150 TaxID=3084054 RepID=UPI002FDAB1E8
MAVLKPFRGLRPVQELASQVVSPPYDVLDSEEARKITDNNKYSFLRVTKSEVDLPENIDVHSPVVYEKAAENLQKFIGDRILVQDEKPCFYIYKQKMGDHTQVGLVAAASVNEYQNNIIKKHELTRPDKEQDRVDHITATEAQTGAVFLTYKAEQTLNELIEECMNQAPVYDFTTEDGISHTLYVVAEDKKIQVIENAFAKIDFLYIADGHHRSAAAGRVADLCREKNANHTGNEEYNTFLTVIFPHDMMYIMDYNRVVTDLNGLSPNEFIEKVAEKFDIAESPSGAVKPNDLHTFGMYIDNTWYQLTAKPGTFTEDNPVEVLDVSILQNNLLNPILAIQDPRTDKRINFVGGIRGMAELERLVNSKKYAVAFSMYATSIEQLMDIADAGQIMPPKSTWFEPKLRDAMVVHLTPLIK